MVVILVTIVHVCCIDPHVLCALYGWTQLIAELLCFNTAIVQYLVEETTAQVNATDNVSNANSVKRCLLYVLVYTLGTYTCIP